MNAIRAAPPVWTDPAPVRVLGMGTALPGPPVETRALLSLMDTRFGLDLRTCGFAAARKLGVEARHICRPFDHLVEGPRPGQRNPELAAQAAGGEQRDEAAEHVAGGGIAVQQQDQGGIHRAGLAIEDLDGSDSLGLVGRGHGADLLFLRFWRRARRGKDGGLPGGADACGESEPGQDLPTGKWMQHQCTSS